MSTDDKVVKDLALIYDVEVPYFPRKRELCEDVDTALVMIDIVRFLEEKEGYKPDLICLLQPTSPFRLPEDVDACVKIAVDTDCDTVVSIRKVSEYPQWMFRGQYWAEQGFYRLFPMEQTILKGEVLVSQSLPTLFYPNGAVYITKRNVLVDEGKIFGDDIRGYEMPWERSLDLETEQDFLFAEFVLKMRRKKKEGWFELGWTTKHE